MAKSAVPSLPNSIGLASMNSKAMKSKGNGNWDGNTEHHKAQGGKAHTPQHKASPLD